MVRKIAFFIFLFLCFIFINNNVCFCADELPTFDLEQSEAIFNFVLNTSKNVNSDSLSYYQSSTPTSFMSYFNRWVAPEFSVNSTGEVDSSYHFIVLAKDNSVYFFTTNATLSNFLNWLEISPRTGTTDFDLKFEYCAQIVFYGDNNFGHNFFKSSTLYFPLFYELNPADGKLYPTLTPSFSEDYTTLNTDNLFYLGPKAFSDVDFNGSFYFLQHYFGRRSDDPTEDNPTPSGDTGSGIDYTDVLNNISGQIGETNTKLDGISGEIGQTNTKLDGISGELGEINDSLTSVPDLSGTTINSGDIESALNLNFAEDPYTNFWLELTTGLSSALTSNNRSITIDFRNESYNIKLDDFALQVPEFLKSFLAIISTTLVVWQIVRYIKIIIDKISSGDMDSVLAMNEEERNN